MLCLYCHEVTDSRNRCTAKSLIIFNNARFGSRFHYEQATIILCISCLEILSRPQWRDPLEDHLEVEVVDKRRARVVRLGPHFELSMISGAKEHLKTCESRKDES